MGKRAKKSYEELKEESKRRAERPVTGYPTRADFEKVVSDFLSWKFKSMMQEALYIGDPDDSIEESDGSRKTIRK